MRFVTIGLALLSLAAAPSAGARVTEGETLEPVQLKVLTGGAEALFSRVASANIILFWRPGQEASLDTLKQMAQCEKLFVGKSVHMVAVVSSTYPAAEVKAAADGAGMHVKVLIDADDALYGKLEVRQHPMLVVTDDKGKVALAQPYVRLRYCDIVHARGRGWALRSRGGVLPQGALHLAHAAGCALRARGVRGRHPARRAEAVASPRARAAGDEPPPYAFSAAPSRSRSHSSAKEMSSPAAIFGTSEVAVIPGSVLTSRM